LVSSRRIADASGLSISLALSADTVNGQGVGIYPNANMDLAFGYSTVCRTHTLEINGSVEDSYRITFPMDSVDLHSAPGVWIAYTLVYIDWWKIALPMEMDNPCYECCS